MNQLKWTDEDQAQFVRSMKSDLARLLRDEDDFERLNHWPRQKGPVNLLRICVCALRNELIAWAEAGANK